MAEDPSQRVEYPYMEIVELECELGDSLSDESAIESFVDLIAERFNLQLFETATYKFDPQGITSVGIIGESHISIHTWPELNFCHVEIFSCRKLPPLETISAELEGSVETVLNVRKRSRQPSTEQSFD